MAFWNQWPDSMKRRGRVVLLSALLYLLGLLVLWLAPAFRPAALVPFLLAYAAVGRGPFRQAWNGIRSGEFLDENFLMVIASGGAFFLGEWPEAVAVMLFYQVGELFEDHAVDKSRSTIAALMDIRPDTAWVLRSGEERSVSPDEVSVGELIRVKPGERVPLDGILRRGATSVDTRALTGEPLPAELAEGDAVISGCVNLTGTIDMEVTKAFGESTATRILSLVEEASGRKSRVEHFITRFARWYTPAVVGSAVLLAVIPPLFLGNWSTWLYRALSFLVCSCPCALVLSVPLSFFGGLGGAGKLGILVKGGNYLEALSRTEILALDKTGTLTRGSFAVSCVEPAEGVSREELLELAACAERDSSHPIARSLREAWGKPIDPARIGTVEEFSGYGVRATVDGRTIHAGSLALMERLKVSCPPAGANGTAVYVEEGGVCLGSILVEDEIKPRAREALTRLRSLGVKSVAMLTGDRRAAAEAVAERLGIDDVHSQLLPTDKMDAVEKLMSRRSAQGTLAYVGDGMNDAPVLARADVGIAMGAMGSDAAIEAADVVIMNDDLESIADAILIARRTMRIVRQNIAFILAVKLGVLMLVAVGLANMWAAVFADVGVSVLSILNAMRALNVKDMR
ncbi:heavy metal translocating P-type ATPase [uncultured Mailhella sp.]|uniref:heavy metal translocating P-type ATPase n=1 Tax=uncultured Mailhella sp. TaxID=1981031 RepID=UPI002631B77C|nr:heavy metal translocating P-type ATPase [uncultured Mailhella sp.]